MTVTSCERTPPPPGAFCAEYKTGSTCKGDSGSALVTELNGVYEQQGITSYGINFKSRPKPSCGEGSYASGYTDVRYFMPWIQKNLKL
jgi:secreted trypsin-like serine protease